MEVSSTVPVSQIPALSSPSQSQIPVKLEPVASEKAAGPVKWPKCTKTYNSKWENDPLLKTWIARHPRDNGKVVCRFCQSIIRAHKNDLLEHTRTLKHQRNFMQNSTPEEYNQFVMELNELRKEANAMSKKRTTLSNTATTTANSDMKPQICLTSVTAANSNIPTLTTSTINSSQFLSINNNSNGVLGDVLDNEELWQDGDEYMNAESPSDLVSVILEEQQSPTSTSTTLSTGSCASNNNNISLAPMTLSINGINMNLSLGTSPLSTTSTTINPAPSNDNCIQNEQINESAQSLTLQSYTIENNDRFNFTSTDVMQAIQEGAFTLRELCALAKAATSQIEYSFLLSSPDTGTVTSVNDISNCVTPVSTVPSNAITLSTSTCVIPVTSTITTNSRPNQTMTTRNGGRTMRKRKAAASTT